ncbi:DUF1365 domain-containing protein [Labrenzia sp. 011]|uniref:DUF1365 domain-containing protein n=1 Tax=Labrenzia sp. 011 TaxID=2171494 RepID=UPI000D520458|nr:DUF1365 domain-containing protein [Labrenzia sp. 011]PVB63630.1 DUF1365 domain-containing protein [Labrenzia sp. 011]
MKKAFRSNRLSDNGPLPACAAALYSGEIMHARMKPKEHRFTYSVFSLLLDLDRLDEARRSSRLFSVNRFNLLSFHEKDHGPRDGSGLRTHIEDLLGRQGLAKPDRILLLAYPRVLGYGFNPLSVYYAYGADGQLSALVYEVRNTFGGMHTYALPLEPGQLSDAGVRQEQRKAFHVSPFIDMDQKYHFRMLPPGDAVRVRILEKDPEGPLLSATFSGVKLPFTSRYILRECLRIPFLTFKVMFAIHWEAVKLWRKHIPFHSAPAPDQGDHKDTRHTSLASKS